MPAVVPAVVPLVPAVVPAVVPDMPVVLSDEQAASAKLATPALPSSSASRRVTVRGAPGRAGVPLGCIGLLLLVPGTAAGSGGRLASPDRAVVMGALP
ncbi:MAG: hypothetical protein KDB35_22495 [Acidimicrobiales bacterium]|nr:hypothetical protein [Acidimicrobiales bacterium]